MASELLNEMILSAVSDDYESSSLILESLRHIGTGRRRWTQDDIEQGLRELKERGLVAAYLLSADSNPAVEVSMASRPINHLWFYATAKGRALARGIDELQSAEQD